MESVVKGDRVQVLCTSRLQDGTSLESDRECIRPYWIRTGHPVKLRRASDTLMGMRIGERKEMMVLPEDGLGSRTIVYAFEVIEIRKPA